MDRSFFHALFGGLGSAVSGVSLLLLVAGFLGVFPVFSANLVGLVVVLSLSLAGVLGVGAAWYGFFGIRSARRLPEAEDRILEIANENDGRVTIPLVASNADVSLEETEKILTRMARGGYVRLLLDEDGGRVFVFPGLPTSNSELYEDDLDRRLAKVQNDETPSRALEATGPKKSLDAEIDVDSDGEQRFALGVVLDESGSMEAYREAAIGGYNELLENQRNVDAGSVMLVHTTFNDQYPPTLTVEDLDSAEPLDETSYRPRGRTALLDAVGFTIDAMRERFDEMAEDERPSDVLVAVITDGKENASEEYTELKVRAMTQYQQDEQDWEFVYIGAGIDDFTDARSMGISGRHTSKRRGSAAGIRRAYEQISSATTSMRVLGDLGDFQTDSSTSTG